MNQLLRLAKVTLLTSVFLVYINSLAWSKDTGEGLTVRTYYVNISFFTDDLRIKSQNDKVTYDEKKLLTSRGIQFPAGTSATYTPATRKLVIINSSDQIVLFEGLVNSN